jgi:uncharacterized protein (DUF1499 family)
MLSTSAGRTFYAVAVSLFGPILPYKALRFSKDSGGSMSEAVAGMPQRSSLWCPRLALFALALVAVALLLHRFFGMPTPVLLNVLAVGLVLALAAVLLGALGTLGVWRTGRSGGARILLGTTVGAAMLAVPVSAGFLARAYPALNDVTTDSANPPEYRTIAALRTGTANSAVYPASQFADLQKAAHPDLLPLDINRPPAETFDLVVDVLKGMQMTVVAEEPPSDDNPAGRAEAVDRSLVLGFYDDVAIRVRPIGDPADPNSRVDLRSSSRYGRADFGANAQRMRDMMREIVARLEATVPAIGDVPSANKRTLKPGRASDREKADGRTSRGDARPDARRAPERKAPPP